MAGDARGPGDAAVTARAAPGRPEDVAGATRVGHVPRSKSIKTKMRSVNLPASDDEVLDSDPIDFDEASEPLPWVYGRKVQERALESGSVFMPSEPEEEGAESTAQVASGSLLKARQSLPAKRPPPVVDVGPTYRCPTYVSDSFGKNGLWVNPGWSAHGWGKACKRGNAYSKRNPTLGANIGRAVEMMKQLRALAVKCKYVDLPAERTKPSWAEDLNDDDTFQLSSEMWCSEFNYESILEIYQALLPDRFQTHSDQATLMATSKTDLVEILVMNRVPFVFFSWMELLAAELREGAYKQLTSSEMSRIRMLNAMVFSSAAEFKLVEDDVLKELKEDAIAEDEAAKGMKRKAESPQGGSAEAPPPTPAPMKRSRAAVVPPPTAAVRDDESGAEEEGGAEEGAPSDPPSNSESSSDESEPSDGGEEERKRRQEEILRKRVVKSQSTGKKAKAKRTAKPDYSGVDVASALAETAKALAKLAKAQKPKKAGPTLTYLEKHIERLDESLRRKKFINPTAYSSQHLINIEMKGAAPTKTRLAISNGTVVADEDASDDVAGAPNSLAALKEGLSFIAQRLIKLPEFNTDMDVGLDRFEFIRWIESDFIHASPSNRMVVLLEFLRRVADKRLWMPEIKNQNTLLFRAFTGVTSQVQQNGGKVDQEQFGAPDQPTRGRDRKTRGTRSRGRGGRGRGALGRGAANSAQAQIQGGQYAAQLFTQAQRDANGVCPSRSAKGGACPNDAEPWNCKFSHMCPRCPNKRHRAVHCPNSH